MMVDAQKFPGPALRQGLMLCLLPFLGWAMFSNDGRHMKLAVAVYALVGFVLFVLIVLFVGHSQ